MCGGAREQGAVHKARCARRCHLCCCRSFLSDILRVKLGGDEFDRFYQLLIRRIGDDCLQLYTELENRKIDPPILRDTPIDCNGIIWARMLTHGVKSAFEFICQSNKGILKALDEEKKYIRKMIQDEKKIKEDRLEHLVALYEKMEPKRAAKVFESLDQRSGH